MTHTNPDFRRNILVILYKKKNMTFASLCCNRNMNDAWKHSALPRVSSRHFVRLKWRHSCFYHSKETCYSKRKLSIMFEMAYAMVYIMPCTFHIFHTVIETQILANQSSYFQNVIYYINIHILKVSRWTAIL